ncbi:S8 family serine peptidase [Alkalicoccobacillus murimartini]|uniref:Bacillopeptidase F n=1 Tax=Alkalicoccobacillus murimartini TaxID=171685 RepID=A0ABT9YJE3_9BACI|nr:S8 family serine peptidase [Alkalicoccobacillus murimartini]MDQ0207615.1 bacillopeptidase F [Alkalicoccobacillus murimartini]
MPNKMRIRQFVSISLTMLFIFTLLLPHQTLAQSASTSVFDSAQTSSEKISDRLYEEFEKEEYVTFLLKFKEQVDTAEVAASVAGTQQAQNASASQMKLLERSAIVSSLRATSIDTQKEVTAFLEKELEEDRVKDFESFFIVNGMAVTGTKEVMEKLATRSEVEKVLPNEVRQLNPTEQTSSETPEAAADSDIEWNIGHIGAPAVWEQGIDGSGIVVASIDTGVQWDHPGLVEQYRGYDPANPESPTHDFNWFDATAGENVPYDDDGHGTHVTGTMVGVEPDGSNAVGVAPGAKWIGVKAFTDIGGTDADLLAAGEWIIAPTDADGNPQPEKAPDIVNNSWGGGPGIDEWYRPMVQNWRAANIFPEFSAGNTNFFNPGGPGSVANPANYPESFATGATDINDNLAGFSLRGPSPYEEIKPEIAAPGVNIRSTVPGSGYEGGWNGTSMAGPHVAAVAALLLQANASLTVDDLEEVLTSTAIPLTDDEYPETPNHGFGHGLVNAYDAVASVLNGIGTVAGSVTKDGEDTEPPAYEHEPVTEGYAGVDIPLAITATDDIGVTGVELSFRTTDDWTSVEASLVDGNHLSGSYAATIPSEVVEGESIEYKWTITDFGDNVTESDTYEISILAAIGVGYEEDFATKPHGWYSFGSNDVWEWGEPQSGPGEALTGDHVYATNLAGDHPNNANMTLVMPPIDLEDGAAYLQFTHWHELENNYDFAHVFISTDGQQWEALERFNGATADWIETEIDLSDYAEQRIYLGFNVTSDFSITNEGWFLDQVTLSDESTSPSFTPGVEPPNHTYFNHNMAKEEVDPSKIQPAQSSVKKPAVSKNDPAIELAALPVQATVNVLESGRSVQTNPADGSYQLKHAPGDFTLRADAYGFQSEEQTITVEADATTTAHFTLTEIAEGTVNGVVSNDATGEPIAGATITLLEDGHIAPVQSNEQGEYELSAYEGSYTLQFTAPGYYSQTIEVTIEGNDTVSHDVSLEPFIGYEGEIGYDDGTAENARVFFEAGNGWAVRMSLAEGEDRALVTGGLFRFWDEEWPVPGGTAFKVAVYDASGSNGAPGNQIAGPIDATAERDGSWTEVDLSGEGILVEGDFYLVYIQSVANPNAPGLATDEDGPLAERSWEFVGGSWSQTPAIEGNYMIRAKVNYELSAPTITSPEDGSFTSDEIATVEGTSSAATDITIYNNGEEAGSTTTDEAGGFTTDIELSEGNNELTATAVTDSGESDSSEPVTIILDQTSVELEITEPVDGSKSNRETVTVKGTATDDHLDTVTVNGQGADLKDDGTFSKRILLDNGSNDIEVIATDKAGNETSEHITIDVKFDKPVIENLKPDEDKDLKSGESVKIEFTSEEDLDATFIIRMPLTNTTSNATELPIREESDGVYVGYWTATSNVEVEGAQIEVIVRDDYGNETREVAPAKLNVNVEE